MSSALPFINIYVCTKFNFNPFCTFQDMAGQASIMKKWLWEYNSINKIGLSFWCTALPLTFIYLQTKFNINQFCTLKDMAQTDIHYEKKWLRGDNSVNIQGRIMVLVHCPSSHFNLPINQVSFQSIKYPTRYGLARHPLRNIVKG